MKNLLKKTASLLLLLCISAILLAQTVSYKSINEELTQLKKQLVPDKRVAILEVGLKDTLQQAIVILGETDLPDAKNKVIQWLTDKNISFIDSIRVLPDGAVGDKTWALATLSVANLRAKPDDASELSSQVLMGTPLKVLDTTPKWYRVQTPENYIGWIDAAGIQLLTANEINTWKKANRCIYNRITGVAIDAPGKKGKVVTDLILGDLFEVESIHKGYLKIKTPDGRPAYIHKSECTSFDDWCNIEPTAKSLLSVASQMMGFPYLWGGTSSKAIDCSGFVKTVYYSQGVILARDASQQARYGEPIDFTNRENLQPGDLLFFGRSAQRISHVGIYIGNGDFIHSSGKVHISSIDPNDPKYVATRNNVAARRILNALNTEGIVRVKDHEWYKHP